MGMKLAERHSRDQTLFYMNQSVEKLSQNAVISITKSPELKNFLLFLVEHEPKRMKGILKTASEKAEAILSAMDAEKGQEEAAKKRAAPSVVDLLGRPKRAKLAAAMSGTATNNMHCETDCEMTDHATVAPPAYSSTVDVEEASSDAEIDDGVELATSGTPDQSGQEKAYPEEPADDEKDREEEEDDNAIDDNASESIHNEVQRADIQKETSTQEPLQHSNQAADEQDDDMGHQDSQSAIPNQQNTQRRIQPITQAELHYRLERGLTNGDPKTISALRTTSPILLKPEADPIFDLCLKLDFVPLRFALVRYHRNRLTESDTDSYKKPDRVVPTTTIYGLEHPDEIYDSLCVNKSNNKAGKIDRAYGQMRLFEEVNRRAREQLAGGGGPNAVKEGPSLYTWHLENLAIRKAGNVSEDEQKFTVEDYKRMYRDGSKWTDVCNWFGGKGVVLVFVAAEIGSQHIARGLKQESRLALRELAPYLRCIRKMVRTLGSDALDQYCRYGHLSAEKIRALEEMEGDAVEDVEGEQNELGGDDH